MTRNETITLIQTILVMYPGSKINPDQLTVAIWHKMLEDLPGDVVNAAVMRMCATLRFPPSIADIRKAVTDAVTDAAGIPIAGDAWAKVSKARSRWGCYRGEEARAELGEEIWHAVEMVGGWQEICFADKAVISAQFERRYNAMIEQRSQLLQIPAAVSEQMAALAAPLAERIRLKAPEKGCCAGQENKAANNSAQYGFRWELPSGKRVCRIAASTTKEDDT